MRTSILGTYFLASPDEHEHGMRWYDRANDQAIKLAASAGIAVSTAAGVIAALSPNNAWDRNLIDAYNIIRSYVLHGADDASQVRVCTFASNKDKAIRILGHLNPEDVLGGQKVLSFYRLIHQPWCNEVCIDGHAYSVWKGERVATTKVPKITPKLYAQIQQDYRECASIVSGIKGQTITPSQLQAITWTVHRNLYRGVRG